MVWTYPKNATRKINKTDKGNKKIRERRVDRPHKEMDDRIEEIAEKR